MMEPLISIVIPVYNAEKTIVECVNTIENQTYKNLEIILVNDGSTDNSELLCKELVNKNNNITYIAIKNSGSGIARNIGIENSNGEFLVFVDSDDWLSKESIMILYNSFLSSRADIVVGRITNKYRIGDIVSLKKECEPIQLQSIDECNREMLPLIKSGVLMGPVAKLYKKEIIEKYDIHFPDLRRSQDIVFNYRYFSKVQSCYVIPDVVYFVRYNGQYMQKLPEKYYETMEVIFNDLYAFLDERGLIYDGESLDNLYDYCFDSIALNAESNALNKRSNKNLVNSAFVQKISQSVHPTKTANGIVRYCIVRKNLFMLKIVTVSRNLIRKVRNRIKG